MEMKNVSDLISHPRNSEFFDDITGDNWREFLESVRTSGVIEPVVITQDEVIVSGHQRVRACIELNDKEFQTIPCRIKIYKDSDKWNKDDLIIKELLETNLRQRGIGNLNPVKFARCIVELERLYGIQKGNNQISLQDNLTSKTQSQLAEELGMSRQQLQDYKKLLTLIPELQELVEKDKLSATTGYKVWAKLSPEDQQKLFEQVGKDKIKEMTQKEAQKYVDELNKLKQEKQILKQQLEQEKNKKTVTEYIEIESPKLKEKIAEMEEEKRLLENEKSNLKSKLNQLENDKRQTSEEYKDLSKKYKEVINEKQKLEEQVIPLREKLKKEEQFIGFQTSVKIFLDATASLAYKENILKELPVDEKKKFGQQLDLLEKFINDFKTILK